MRYFCKPIAGTLYTRYYLLAGHEIVVGTQISRPDGTEVPEPVRWHDRRLRARTADPGKQRSGAPAFYARSLHGDRPSRRRVPKGAA